MVLKLDKIAREIRSLRARSGNIRDHDLISLAKKLGRRLQNRGKHLTFVSDIFQDLRALPIPSHPRGINRITAENILDALDEDFLRWEELLEKSSEDR